MAQTEVAYGTDRSKHRGRLWHNITQRQAKAQYYTEAVAMAQTEK